MLSDDLKTRLSAVSTATITSQLQKRGLQNCFLSGLRPLHEDRRMVGTARTLRYLPVRPDLYDLLDGDPQPDTVEAIEPGDVLVIDARGEPDAGTIGDIYASRVQRRGGAGVVTDGALRDTPAIKALGLAVYHRSSHASLLSRRHVAVDYQLPIACAGATVMPGDVMVGDGEGAVAIPHAMADEIADASMTMEIEEEFALKRIAEGAAVDRYFPLADEARAEFEAWLAERKG